MNLKKVFGLVGLALGLAQGLYVVVRAYIQVPGPPGWREVVFQLVIVAILAAVYGGIGYGIGFVATLFRRRR